MKMNAPTLATDQVSEVERSIKRITVIATGGTIAENPQEVPDRGHLSAEQLLRHLSPVPRVEILSQDLFDVPSSCITFDHMWQIATAVDAAFDKGVDGVVVTHGTATLEETAYFVDLLHKREHPVVFTGAMFPPGTPEADGNSNLRNALLIAASEEARNRGVLVTLSGDVYAAEEVTKAHSTDIDAFKSNNFEPLGSVHNNRVIFHRSVSARDSFIVLEMTARVEGVKCYASMSDILLRALVQAGVDGVVLETFGSGQVPPSLMPAIRELVSSGAVVVATSRCFSGYLSRNQSSQIEGEGPSLQKSGVLFSDLQGPKARIKLTLSLSAGLSLDELKRIF
jgi:L-asparaginase